MIDLAKIIQNVNQQRGLLFQPASCHIDKYIAEFSGYIENVGGITISFTENFPTQLPDIYLQDTSKPHLHVDNKGKICLTDQSSLLIDTTHPTQLVLECIDRALQIVGLSPDSPKYQEELKKEFLSYWGTRERRFSCDSILRLPPDNTLCQEYPIYQFEKQYLLANSIYDANAFLCNTLGNKVDIERPSYQALVIRLKKGSSVPTPFRNYDWSTVLHYILHNTDAKTHDLFLTYTSRCVKKYILFMVLVLPDVEGDILFGFLIRFTNQHKMPMKASRTKIVYQLDISRADYDFQLLRCGATPSLYNKKVLLLGCGSIGGFLANNLCQMGITQLDLLDNDMFTMDNVHRHFMGFDAFRTDASAYKADLLKCTLNEKYAYLDLDSLNYIDRSVENVILAHPERLSSYDLVISALGEPTLNLEINRLLIENNISTPFLVCFNEPYGIGGHVITTNLSQESCLRCFYSNLVSGSLVPFLGSLVQPNQNFKRSLSGCSGIFVPYSTLDSQQTAIFAARKAIEILNGALRHNDLVTWKGDPFLLESHGYKLSPYFHRTPNLEGFTNQSCPVCKRKHVQS